MVEVEMDWLTGLFGTGKSNNASKNLNGAMAPHNHGNVSNLENPPASANGAIATVNGAVAPHNVHVPNASVVGGRSRKHRKDRSRKDRKDRKHRKSRRSSRN
jgi:hypothetical protein